jgi:hypothetical protein
VQRAPVLASGEDQLDLLVRPPIELREDRLAIRMNRLVEDRLLAGLGADAVDVFLV